MFNGKCLTMVTLGQVSSAPTDSADTFKSNEWRLISWSKVNPSALKQKQNDRALTCHRVDMGRIAGCQKKRAIVMQGSQKGGIGGPCGGRRRYLQVEQVAGHLLAHPAVQKSKYKTRRIRGILHSRGGGVGVGAENVIV